MKRDDFSKLVSLLGKKHLQFLLEDAFFLSIKYYTDYFLDIILGIILNIVLRVPLRPLHPLPHTAQKSFHWRQLLLRVYKGILESIP